MLKCSAEQVQANNCAAAACAGRAGRELWGHLFQEATTSPELLEGPCAAGSHAHRRRMRMWQALTVLSAFVRPEEASRVVEQIWLLLKVPHWLCGLPCLVVRIKCPVLTLSDTSALGWTILKSSSWWPSCALGKLSGW